MDTLREMLISGVAFLATMLFGPSTAEALLGPQGDGGPDMYITVSPDPLVEGQQGKVCYDFAGSGQTGPVVLDITWTLTSGVDVKESVTVDPSNPCHYITPPTDAGGVNIVDTSGVSQDYGGSVSPPTPPIG